MNRTDEGTEDSNRQKPITQRQQKSCQAADGYTHEGERHRAQQGGHQAFGAEKVGGSYAQKEPAKILPGVGGGDGNIGHQQTA